MGIIGLPKTAPILQFQTRKSNEIMRIIDLGLLEYQKSLQFMNDTHEKVSNKKEKNTLLIVEHPPTVTMGNRELSGDMLYSQKELKFKGIQYVKIDRGGSATVHEPGQIVVYPILHLENISVKNYVAALEEAVIQTCKSFQIHSQRDCINPGVWVGENKIAAIGIRVSNKVTKHGLAFNVTNTLETFRTIIPCGLKNRGVTSLQKELPNTHINKEEVKQKIIINLQEQLSAIFYSSDL